MVLEAAIMAMAVWTAEGKCAKVKGSGGWAGCWRPAAAKAAGVPAAAAVEDAAGATVGAKRLAYEEEEAGGVQAKRWAVSEGVPAMA